MSKSVWAIAIMGILTVFVLVVAMAFSLGQFQETPVVEWVKLAEAINHEFKMENAAVRVNLSSTPTAMRITYVTRVDSHFDLALQNQEMERVGTFALKAYKGRELPRIDQVLITRSETHGSGCFQSTYVASFTVPNNRRQLHPGVGAFGVPGEAPKER